MKNKNIKTNTVFKILFIGLGYFFIFLSATLGAQLNFYPSIGTGQKFYEISPRQEFKLDIYLDSQNESINTFSAEVIYPADLIELKNILDGGSILNLWIEKPHTIPLIEENITTNKNKIIFAGIVPGGFNGRAGFITSLIFQAKNSGVGKIYFSNVRAFLNDGLGTETKVGFSDFNFNILSSGVRVVTSTFVVLPIDNLPPEDFKPQILKDLAMFDNKYFLVFEAQDKGRGIDHYEILEWKEKFSVLDLIKKIIYFKSYNINNRFWITAQSPYVLSDQNLESTIYVKAVDKAGNERIVILPAQNPIRWYENYENWIIIILGFLILIIIFLKKFKLKFINKK